MLLVDSCTTCIINLFFFIADLFHNDTLLSGWQNTDQATSLETEHTVFYMLPVIMSPWLLGYKVIFMIETLD
jgi:hypothetical protein